jgi:hypothetical protein
MPAPFVHESIGRQVHEGLRHWVVLHDTWHYTCLHKQRRLAHLEPLQFAAMAARNKEAVVVVVDLAYGQT